MTFIGKVSNGTVVLPADAHLPEGTEVRVEPIGSATSRRERAATLRKVASEIEGLPADLAKQHDHYLYGTPRQ